MASTRLRDPASWLPLAAGASSRNRGLIIQPDTVLAEFGGAVGVTFTFGSAIAVSMYTIGFCESLFDMLHQYVPSHGHGGNGGFILDSRINDVRLVGIATIAVLFVVAIVGMNVVSRIQIGLLVLLVLAQVGNQFNT